MTETVDVTQRLLDLLNRYPGVEDVPGRPVVVTEDVEQIQDGFDRWYNKWIKQTTCTWPANNVLHSLNFLRTKYIELVTDGDTQPRTVRRVERISEVCRILHDLKQQGINVRMTDGSDIYSNRSHEGDIEETPDGVGEHIVLDGNVDGVAREKEGAGGRESYGELIEGGESQPEPGRRHDSGAPTDQRALIASLELRTHDLTQELQYICSSSGLIKAIVERPDLHRRVIQEIYQGSEPELIANGSTSSHLTQGIPNVGGGNKGTTSRDKRREGNSDGSGTDPMLRMGGSPIISRRSGISKGCSEARALLEKSCTNSLGRAMKLLRNYDPETMMRDDLVVAHDAVIPVVEKIRTSVQASLGKYHKYDDYDPDWEQEMRDKLEQVDERCDAITMKLVEKGGKQATAIAAMHRQIKPFAGNEALSIFEFLPQVEMATTSMGNQQERSSIIVNQYLDEKIRGLFTSYTCQPYSNLKAALIEKYGRVTEIVYKILRNTLKLSPPVQTAPEKDIHAHLLELETCMSRIQAVRNMPEVKGTHRLKELDQTIHERGFYAAFQQKWAQWLLSEFATELLKQDAVNVADYGWRYKQMELFIRRKVGAYGILVDDVLTYNWSMTDRKKAEKQNTKVYRAVETEVSTDGNQEQNHNQYCSDDTWNAYFAKYVDQFECCLDGHAGHALYNCNKFLRMDPKERFSTCKGRVCFTCLAAWGPNHGSTCPTIPEILVCQACSKHDHKHPLNVLFCGRPGHNKPSARAYLHGLKQYREDANVSAQQEKIIKIMMLGKQNADQSGMQEAHETHQRGNQGMLDTLTMRQTWTTTCGKVNVLYDTGASVSLILQETAEKMGLENTGQEQITIATLGGTIRTDCGQYKLKTDCFQKKYRSSGKEEHVCLKLQGIRSMGVQLERVDLKEINHEMERSTFLGSSKLRNCAEGGNIDIIIGIDNVEFMPRYLGTLMSGVDVYRSCFFDDVGSQIVYCGQHDSFIQPVINLHCQIVDKSVCFPSKGLEKEQGNSFRTAKKVQGRFYETGGKKEEKKKEGKIQNPEGKRKRKVKKRKRKTATQYTVERRRSSLGTELLNKQRNDVCSTSRTEKGTLFQMPTFSPSILDGNKKQENFHTIRMDKTDSV